MAADRARIRRLTAPRRIQQCPHPGRGDAEPLELPVGERISLARGRTSGAGFILSSCVPMTLEDVRDTGVDVVAVGRSSFGLLALLYAISGGLCLASALWPMNEHTPTGVLAVLGGVGLVVGGLIWFLRYRLGMPALHLAVALFSTLIGLVAWRSATAVGIVGLGPVVLATALYAAHFLSLLAARLQVLFLVAVVSAGAWAAAPSRFLFPWLDLVVAVLVLAEAQGRLAHALRTAAATDPLTGVANRRAWEAEAERHIARAARTGEPVTIALLDLDEFKEVNDRDGHHAGDMLLRELTVAWRTRLRRADFLGRYGGDEFVLCLPATDEAGADELLDQLRSTHGFTWSSGAATARGGESLTVLLSRADAALYADKRGR
jgi:diguanylate cyclase (GGDEF)-like protein